jgi:acyl-CoA hydrolase
MLEETSLFHIVMPEDLNPHETLFAGQMAKWLVEASGVCAMRAVGKYEGVIMIKLTEVDYKKAILNSEVIEIRSKIAYAGKSSLIVSCKVFSNADPEPRVTAMAVFITVDEQNKPFAHGLKLSDEYIQANRDIYEAALNIKKQG